MGVCLQHALLFVFEQHVLEGTDYVIVLVSVVRAELDALLEVFVEVFDASEVMRDKRSLQLAYLNDLSSVKLSSPGVGHFLAERSFDIKETKGDFFKSF